MNDAKTQRRLFRFGMFELDAATGDLRKAGKSRPRIRDQALQILTMLLEKPEDLSRAKNCATGCGPRTRLSISTTG